MYESHTFFRNIFKNLDYKKYHQGFNEHFGIIKVFFKSQHNFYRNEEYGKIILNIEKRVVVNGKQRSSMHKL